MADGRPPLGTPDARAAAGATVIADRVVERIAERAALEVPGVASEAGSLGAAGSIGGLRNPTRLPKAAGDIAGGRGRIALSLAVTWPSALAPVAQQVRSHVATRVGELTGLTVDQVDVAIVKVSLPAPERRRVQ